jgi:hypothetical protein
MTTTEIKDKIHRAIEKIPEESLKDVLGLINKIQSKQYIDDKTINGHLDAIISENKELLEKLAQ